MLQFRPTIIASNYAATLIVNRHFFHCGNYVLYTSQNVAKYFDMIGFLKKWVLKISPKYTTQSLPTRSHITRLFPFLIFWAPSYSKTFKSVCCLESFIFRFLLNLLKCALFYSTYMPYLSKISNNNIVRSPINIVLKKYNLFSFNVICSMVMKKKLTFLPYHWCFCFKEKFK